MKRYRVGVLYEFDADDLDHATEQLDDALGAGATVSDSLNFAQVVEASEVEARIDANTHWTMR